MKKTPRSFHAIAVPVIAMTVSLWLVVMLLVTWGAAIYFRRDIQSGVEEFFDRSPLRNDYCESVPGLLEYSIIDYLKDPESYLIHSSLYPTLQETANSQPYSWIYDQLLPSLELPKGYDYSLIYFDEQDEAIMHTGNLISFPYVTETTWNDHTLTNLPYDNYLCIDLDAIPGAAQAVGDFRDSIDDEVSGSFFRLCRLTGWFEGDQFYPVSIEDGHHGPSFFGCPASQVDISSISNNPELWYSIHDRYQAVDVWDSDHLHYLALANDIEWRSIFSRPAEEGRELVTIYGYSLRYSLEDPPHSVNFNGKTYPTLTDLRLESGVTDGTFGNLQESVFIRTVKANCEDSDDTYTYALTVRCRPLQYALVSLIPTYIRSGVFVFIVLLLILWRLHENLTSPLKDLLQAQADGQSLRFSSNLAETNDLEAHYVKMTADAKHLQAEKIRLNTALGYARDAEERRKEMVANMGQEMKTPLAEIHNYAAQLQSATSVQAQERCIEAIVRETERMDTTVMQVLALSRLEAGKVKLHMQTLILRDIIEYVAEMYQPRMEEKGLELKLDLVSNVKLYADHAQMELVISYYMDKALNSASSGSRIYVRSVQGNHGIFFYIVCPGPHLDEESLNNVYVPFKNSDLRLPIAGKILSQHNHKAYARNTTVDGQDAVEYGFQPNA
jgi:signal transduction histidine kinase